MPNFGPGTTPATLRAWIEFAEESGFSLATVSDHVAPATDVTALYQPPFYDPFTTLSWLAGFTERLSLGISVAILPYRHPLLTARISANLHQITDGRFVLGTGVGWAEAEFDALGVSFADRGRITTSTSRSSPAPGPSPASPSRATTCGSTTSRRDQRPDPVPTRRSGSGAPARPRSSGPRASVMHGTPETRARALLEKDLPLLASAAAELGRPTPSLSPRIKARLTSRDIVDPDRPLGVGSVAQIRDDLAWLDDLGADVVVLDTNPDHPGPSVEPAADDWRDLAAHRPTQPRALTEPTSERRQRHEDSRRSWHPVQTRGPGMNRSTRRGGKTDRRHGRRDGHRLRHGATRGGAWSFGGADEPERTSPRVRGGSDR